MRFFRIKQKARKTRRAYESNQIRPHIESALKSTPVEVCGEAFDEHAQAD